MQPLILLGTGRSGTTIFMDALFCHKDLAFFPNYLERKPNWLWLNYIRRCHDNRNFRILKKRDNSLTSKLINTFISKPVEGYSIWRYILPEHLDFSRGYLNEYSISKSEKEYIHDYLYNVKTLQNRSRLALKITGPGRLKFLSELFPDAKFIWLRRDFIPVLSSFLKVDFYQNRQTQELWWRSDKVKSRLEHFPEIKDDPILFTAFQLHEIINDIETSIRELKLDVQYVDYEQFTENPLELLEQTLDFCKLDKDDRCFAFLENTSISNRNKSDLDYFDESTLQKIDSLRNKLRLLDEN